MISLRTLSEDYYNRRLSFVEYREQRNSLLDMIDEDLNGVKTSDELEEQEDITVTKSILDKALSFLK